MQKYFRYRTNLYPVQASDPDSNFCCIRVIERSPNESPKKPKYNDRSHATTTTRGIHQLNSKFVIYLSI